jgi:small subunit ribosomal protein S4
MTRKRSEYEQQLREKQKAKRIYGVLEKQFRNYFKKAERERGIAGENLLRLLECRLDNLVYRLGFAPSRKAARQLIRHRHFQVNDRIVDIPSYQVSAGDVISVCEKSQQLQIVHETLTKMAKGRELAWLSVDKVNLTGSLLEVPKREDIPIAVEERLIVELYSR